eukprot:7984473-Ditylum_brightwellii.AAC.1
MVATSNTACSMRCSAKQAALFWDATTMPVTILVTYQHRHICPLQSAMIQLGGHEWERMLWGYHNQVQQGHHAHPSEARQRQRSWPLWGSNDPVLMEAPNRLHTRHPHHQHRCKILHLLPHGISPGSTGEREKG